MRSIIGIVLVIIMWLIITLAIRFKMYSNIKYVTMRMEEKIAWLDERITNMQARNVESTSEITRDLTDVKKVASKLNVKVIKEVISTNGIDYEELKEFTDLNGVITCVAFNGIYTHSNERFNLLQTCLEELTEEGYRYKLVDDNLEITI